MHFLSPLRLTVGAIALACSTLSAAAPTQILFVGNSYTFGRVDPVMSYNAANVHDLTAAFNAPARPARIRGSPIPGAASPAFSSSSRSRAG